MNIVTLYHGTNRGDAVVASYLIRLVKGKQ